MAIFPPFKNDANRCHNGRMRSNITLLIKVNFNTIELIIRLQLSLCLNLVDRSAYWSVSLSIYQHADLSAYNLARRDIFIASYCKLKKSTAIKRHVFVVECTL